MILLWHHCKNPILEDFKIVDEELEAVVEAVEVGCHLSYLFYRMVSFGKTELLTRHSSPVVLVCFAVSNGRTLSPSHPSSGQSLTSALQLNLNLLCVINKWAMLNQIKCGLSYLQLFNSIQRWAVTSTRFYHRPHKVSVIVSSGFPRAAPGRCPVLKTSVLPFTAMGTERD